MDCFTDYYARAFKESNLEGLRGRPGFRFIEGDLGRMDLDALLDGVAFVFHQAAQAGVRASWGQSFAVYTDLNILNGALERRRASHLLVVAPPPRRSGGGRASLAVGPRRRCHPVTKLAAEHLARLYAANFGLPTVSLRYFTVYGPRQRPDMAFHKFLRAIYAGEPIPVYGDGEQTRDFTFVADAVAANVACMHHGAPGSYFNIGGGSRVTLNHCLEVLREVTGRPMCIARHDPQHGDVRHTWADTTAAQTVLGFQPQVSLQEGLAGRR